MVVEEDMESFCPKRSRPTLDKFLKLVIIDHNLIRFFLKETGFRFYFLLIKSVKEGSEGVASSFYKLRS